MALTVAEIEAYVASDYAAKDEMHNLAHIRRVHALAQEIGGHHPHDAEPLMLGAYLHGIIYDEGREDDIRRFLQNAHLMPKRIEQAIQIAWESQKEGVPDTIEGRLLHNAHLLEGGKTFIIVKSLVTGTARAGKRWRKRSAISKSVCWVSSRARCQRRNGCMRKKSGLQESSLPT